MSALAFPPNPCISPSFQPPLYALSNISAAKTFKHPALDNTWDDWFDGDLIFTLTDMANNYSLACHWGGTEMYTGLEDWKKESCLHKSPNGTLVTPPVETRIVTLLNLDRLTLFRNHSLEQPVSIAQYWYCDIGSENRYPEAYQAHANFTLELTCPGKPANSTDGRALPCTDKLSTEENPIMATSLWQPRGVLYPGTPQLVPSPSSLPPSQGLRPPPERDCSYISFLYPYWTVDNLEYKHPSETCQSSTVDGYLDVNLTSRATGSRVRCRWGPGIGYCDVDDQIAVTVCALADTYGTNGSDTSRSTFDVRFTLRNKELTIRQSWTCGDTAGQFSTDFRAEGGALTPTICNSSDHVCRAAQFRVDGYIAKPFSLYPPILSLPQGASNTDCLAKSRPEQRERLTVWTLTRFLWQATTREITNSPYTIGIAPYPAPYNQTLRFTLYNDAVNLTFSCDFNDQFLQNYTDQWFPCFSGGRDPHDRASSISRHRVETYLQWNSRDNQLTFNQTWYCTTPPTQDNPRGVAYKISGHDTIWPPYMLYCGSSTSIWNNASCPRMIWSPETTVCDVTYRAKWCTIGDTQGNHYGDGLYLNPQGLSIDRLASNELVEPEPKPDQWSCTVSSATRPVVWSLRHSARGGSIPNSFLTKTVWWDPANHQTWDRDTAPTYFMMDLVSSVWAGRKGAPEGGLVKEIGLFDEQISRRQTPRTKAFDPTAWYDLNSEPAYFRDLDYNFYNPREWSYRLDLSSPKGAYLELKHSWYCDDLNLDTPIIFNGTWNGHLPLNCTYEFPGPMNKDGTERMESGIYCRLPDGEFSVKPNVTAMTYNGKLYP